MNAVGGLVADIRVADGGFGRVARMDSQRRKVRRMGARGRDALLGSASGALQQTHRGWTRRA